MKCIYKFPVKWIVELTHLRSFSHNGWTYEFESENGRIIKILVTIPMKPEDGLPELINNNVGNLDLQINEPECSGLLRRSIRTLEGFLSVYGLEEIQTDHIDITWVPETDEDYRRLRIPNIKFKFKKPSETHIKAPFSVVQNSVSASTEFLDMEIPLNFFRKGRRDFLERRYIDAIYDFYFLIETLYGNGKSKNSHIKEEFNKSNELLSHAGQILAEGEISVRRRGGRKVLLDLFISKFSNKTPDQYLAHVVDTRGFLHHHSIKNKKIWHPVLEYEYELDALLIQDLCFKICSTKVEAIICKPKA